MIDLSSAPCTRLFTTWGTVLYVDAASGELRHGPIEASPANAVFAADPTATGRRRWGRIARAANGVCEPVVCSAECCVLASRASDGDGQLVGTPLELAPLERGLIALRAGGQFLCAEPTGRITLSRPVCSVWECFLASQDWRSNAAAGGPGTGDLGGSAFDRKSIAHYIISPLLRTNINHAKKTTRLLFFGYPARSHGRVYYDLSKRLYERGYVADVMDWQADHTGYIAKLVAYYDLFVTSLDGVSSLVDHYQIPYERIIALSHGDFDIQTLIDQKGLEPFTRFAGYGVVSPGLLCSSLNLGVTRIPAVLPIGVETAEFHTEIPERLATVGYASTISVISKYGVELKREHLARECAEEAGLEYRRAASPETYLWPADMPAFYRRVDAVLIPSLQEGAGLPAMEAAAAGRLVISTPSGHFPLKAAQGGGLVAPLDAGKFKTFAAAKLRYYRDHPAAFVDACHKIQQAARQFDWQYAIDDWIELIETGRDNWRCSLQANEVGP